MDVFMHVTVFLVLGFLFGSNSHLTHVAAQQTAKYLRVNRTFGFMSTPRKRCLHFIKQLLANNRGMFALMNFTAIPKMSIMKRIHEHFLRLVFGYLLTTLSNDMLGFQKYADTFQCLIATSV